MPALLVAEIDPYLAAAYVLFVVLLVVYIGIMAGKLGRIRRRLDEVAEQAEERAARPPGQGRIAAAEREPGEEPTSVR